MFLEVAKSYLYNLIYFCLQESPGLMYFSCFLSWSWGVTVPGLQPYNRKHLETEVWASKANALSGDAWCVPLINSAEPFSESGA